MLMHIAARRTSAVCINKAPARLIGRRRFRPASLPSSRFGQTRNLSLFPHGSSSPAGDGVGEEATGESKHRPEAIGTRENGRSHKNGTNGRERHFARRFARNRVPKDLPPVELTPWFLDANVKLAEDTYPYTPGKLVITGRENDEVVNIDTESHDAPEASSASAAQLEESEGGSDKTGLGEGNSYHLSQAIFSEIHSAIALGLSVAGVDGAESFPVTKSHLKLHCPLDGGTFFLQKIVQAVGSKLNADIISLDAQDLAEMAGDYLKEGQEANENSMWSLAYDVQKMYPRPSASVEFEQEASEAEEMSADDEDGNDGRPPMPTFQAFTAIPMSGGPMSMNDLPSFIKRALERNGLSSPSSKGQSGSPNIPGLIQVGTGGPSPNWKDLKLSALLEVLVETNQAKRLMAYTTPGTMSNPIIQPAPVDGEESLPVSDATTVSSTNQAYTDEPRMSNIESPAELPKTIIYITALKEISATQQGRLFLEKLVSIVQRKRKEGQQIMIVGGTSSSVLTPEVSRSAIDSLQTEGSESIFRTLVVTPSKAGPTGGVFYQDERSRNFDINVQNLFDMIRKFSSPSERLVPDDKRDWERDINDGLSSEALQMLEEQVLTFDEIHRAVLATIGLRNARSINKDKDQGHIYVEEIATAMSLLEESDDAKGNWAHKESLLQQGPEESSSSQQESRLRQIRRTANRHEKALLRGVVNPEKIKVTFADVHAAPETIESLRSLTMLSLTRPEAFKYGVLATDKITGLLLYGPPGTGKTMLAKAVAKESGATVLEVSGSDIFDMYVGESEKNVRAIFSLAKKLAPCVVFIDEADAIFASRGSGTNRNSHREMINQFLREWDGMTNTNAFIMIATNRPFDLDDAALRRVPRRLLVDLPSEKDREAILRIHLKDETIEPNVSLGRLAAATNLYSGSDLKNMCVAAALNAVKEENDAAEKHQSQSAEFDAASSTPTSAPYIFPERRTLSQRHFDRAMDEITASVSDDMSSLGAIRKFDEKYGDRRGRRKKLAYGFVHGDGQKEDAAKVRT